jgi:hypothetical protein
MVGRTGAEPLRDAEKLFKQQEQLMYFSSEFFAVLGLFVWGVVD